MEFSVYIDNLLLLSPALSIKKASASEIDKSSIGIKCRCVITIKAPGQQLYEVKSDEFIMFPDCSPDSPPLHILFQKHSEPIFVKSPTSKIVLEVRTYKADGTCESFEGICIISCEHSEKPITGILKNTIDTKGSLTIILNPYKRNTGGIWLPKSASESKPHILDKPKDKPQFKQKKEHKSQPLKPKSHFKTSPPVIKHVSPKSPLPIIKNELFSLSIEIKVLEMPIGSTHALLEGLFSLFPSKLLFQESCGCDYPMTTNYDTIKRSLYQKKLPISFSQLRSCGKAPPLLLSSKKTSTKRLFYQFKSQTLISPPFSLPHLLLPETFESLSPLAGLL
ncbi:hypothetical protein ADUPG1_008932, partial [Aduncisulcus paluster]